jgi:AAA family ATP:ADP antiporter
MSAAQQNSTRDPFPMQSDAARRLVESVRGNGSTATENWNAMNTQTTTAATTSNNRNDVHAADTEASQGLTGLKRTHSHDDDSDSDDEFLDRRAHESRRFWFLTKCTRCLNRWRIRLYGDTLSAAEFTRTLCLSATLFFLIGGYWLLRSVKDPILTALCGVTVIPKAKMTSVVVVLVVVSIYNRLLDSSIQRHYLFYVFGMFYLFVFFAIALALQHATLGLANERPSPGRILGWISYCAIESYGSVMVSLFWSFTNSNMNLETAKASYGIMVATAQVGSIIGPTVVSRYAQSWGVARIYMLGAACLACLQLTLYMYVRIYGTAESNAAKAGTPPKKKDKAGILEGLKLFWQHNYVKGIFAISCLFMVAGTIVDFTLKVLARDFFAQEYPCESGMSCWDHSIEANHGMSVGATAAFTSFMGFFGQATNTLSLFLSLFGTSAVIRYLGLRLTLLLFPSVILAVIIFVRFHPTLYVVFGAMMTFKACSYALNNPTKEILYQPTSSSVKYKAKSWIDIFGARGSKALGSVVTNAFSDSAANLIQNGSLVGMCVASFLIWNATFMGRKFDEYTESGFIVGEGLDEDLAEAKNIEMASSQNTERDTSCALDDDDELGPEEEGQSESEENDSPLAVVSQV